ncbi:MAG: rhodanese-like domain-containing protein [Acidobacteria bacterium]|nr:MAG: rhodanese-like domain-containing protein [Acidobacteriota bacterium]REK00816.1 MAG: rhodanese-like domain-containing protein [Acidobacteriota bacterium]
MVQISKGFRQLVDEAEERVETLDVEAARRAIDAGGVLVVDLRDVRELQREGKIPGAMHVPRGMLEFWVDPASPYHKQELADAPRLLLYCGSGWRSALAARTLQEMGAEGVSHLGGGFAAWKQAGGAIEEVRR